LYAWEEKTVSTSGGVIKEHAGTHRYLVVIRQTMQHELMTKMTFMAVL
jgi:hypothetical protein